MRQWCGLFNALSVNASGLAPRRVVRREKPNDHQTTPPHATEDESRRREPKSRQRRSNSSTPQSRRNPARVAAAQRHPAEELAVAWERSRLRQGAVPPALELEPAPSMALERVNKRQRPAAGEYRQVAGSRNRPRIIRPRQPLSKRESVFAYTTIINNLILAKVPSRNGSTLARSLSGNDVAKMGHF